MGCVREGQDKERLHCRSKTVGSPQFEANRWLSFDLWQSRPQSGVTGAGQEEMIRADSAFPETLRQDRNLSTSHTLPHLQPAGPSLTSTRMMLSVFPVEILLDIVQWLPFTTVASLSALSKSWATFMNTNEPSIYHSISKRYGYIPKSGSDEAAPPEGWKAWCE